MRRLAIMFAATAALALAPTAAGASAKPHAELVHVEVFHGAPNAGKPGPAAANCSNDQPSGTAYSLTGWTVAGPTTARLNATTVPSSITNAVGQLQESFDAWGPSVPKFTVTTGSTVTKQTANRQTDLLFARTQGSALAVTYTWRWTDGTIESDIVFNSGVTWRDLGAIGDGCYENAPYYDLRNIAVHEVGHVYGLAHAAGDRFETMYAYGYSGETLKRTPATGDLLGVADLYS